ncbi:MAG: hypothetical protein MUF84_13885, partial [Anaerolineae bacterium]|nr:hypothetical protein [Anaerolineae bacterium]
MRTKTTTWLSVLVVLALLLPMIAACTQETPAPTTAPQATATTAPDEPEVVEPCAPAATGPLAGVDPRGQTVVWWHNHSSSREEGLMEMVTEFNSTNECGITVE